eukprot:532577-Pyramimonas_sp.AAC.1
MLAHAEGDGLLDDRPRHRTLDEVGPGCPPGLATHREGRATLKQVLPTPRGTRDRFSSNARPGGGNGHPLERGLA